MAVSAESAEEKDAATMPMVKSMTMRVPSAPEAANMGSSSSLAAGRVSPRCCAKMASSTPSERNSRLTGTKASP